VISEVNLFNVVILFVISSALRVVGLQSCRVSLQNAGAVIGKGGSNIKRLRQDVSHRFTVYFCVLDA